MPNEAPSLTPAALVELMREHRRLLLAPAVVGAVLAAFYTVVSPRDWKAEQGLLIRSDAAGYAEQRLGKFTDLSEMKTVQETVLEVARSQSVVTAVLEEVLGQTPSKQDIADFRDKLRLTPPGGAEFGKTEVFYIGVLNPNRQRAVELVQSLTRQLDQRLNEIRDRQAVSMVTEIDRSVSIAREQLQTQVERLAEFERSVGADLIELRHLTSPNGGQSELGQKVLAIDAERRQSVELRMKNEALLQELTTAVANPERLLITPDALLAGQPALRRLKNGLVDAQLAVAKAAGTRTTAHPLVLAARRAQQAVQKELLLELPSAIAGVELELEVAARREAELAAQVDRLRSRTASLASQRTRYAELVASVDSQTAVLEGSLKQLANARAHRAGATSASLLAPIDSVETGAHATGPGRTTVTAAGGLAGLLLGATLVFVIHAPRVGPASYAGQRAPTGPPSAERRAAPAAPPAASPWAVEIARTAAPTAEARRSVAPALDGLGAATGATAPIGA